jgi:hypothetical protein
MLSYFKQNFVNVRPYTCQMERALSRSDLPIEQGPRGPGTLARTLNPLKEVGTVVRIVRYTTI